MNGFARACAALGLGLPLFAAIPALAASPIAAATPTCETCHGTHGEGMAAAQVPRLAGQSADYLQKQLDDYADGTRDNSVMANLAKALSKPQRARFAALYAAMSAPYLSPGASPDAVRLARGQQLANQGDETKRAPACNGCHGPDGIGVPHAAPNLAGQSAEYLAAALTAFRQGARKNDAGHLMRSVAERLDDGDIAAVTDYFARKPATPRDLP